MEDVEISFCDTNDDEERTRTKRNKVPNPESWQKNQRKFLRNTGQKYISVRGQEVPARRVRPKDCSSCRKNCNVAFPEAERLKIHKSFWGLGDSEKQKLFISPLVEELPVANVRTKAPTSRRTVTRQYYFRSGRTKVAVCKAFFMATLDISETVVNGIVRNRDETSYFPKESQRGKKKSTKGRPEGVKETVRAHIRSYIRVDAPTAGARKKKKSMGGLEVQYVTAGLNSKRLYEAYVAQCRWNGVEPEKQWLYREILNKEFNIKFEEVKGSVDRVVGGGGDGGGEEGGDTMDLQESVVQPSSSTNTIYYEEY